MHEVASARPVVVYFKGHRDKAICLFTASAAFAAICFRSEHSWYFAVALHILVGLVFLNFVLDIPKWSCVATQNKRGSRNRYYGAYVIENGAMYEMGGAEVCPAPYVTCAHTHDDNSESIAICTCGSSAPSEQCRCYSSNDTRVAYAGGSICFWIGFSMYIIALVLYITIPYLEWNKKYHKQCYVMSSLCIIISFLLMVVGGFLRRYGYPDRENGALPVYYHRPCL